VVGLAVFYFKQAAASSMYFLSLFLQAVSTGVNNANYPAHVQE
jgi:hypothetical protein